MTSDPIRAAAEQLAKRLHLVRNQHLDLIEAFARQQRAEAERDLTWVAAQRDVLQADNYRLRAALEQVKAELQEARDLYEANHG